MGDNRCLEERRYYRTPRPAPSAGRGAIARAPGILYHAVPPQPARIPHDHTERKQPPCGTWPSPISAAVVAAGAAPLSQVALDGADCYWLAGRASEGGRTTLLRQRGGHVTELTPAPFNVRTRVHEYGGGACLVADGDGVVLQFRRQPPVRGSATARRRSRSRPAGTQRYADFVLDRAPRAPGRGARRPRAPAAHTRSTPCARSASTAARRCWSRAATSMRRRACRRTAASSPGCAGTIRACRGRAPNCGWPTSTPTARWPTPRLVAGGADEVDLPARMVAGRRAALRLRPQRLVEPVPRSTAARCSRCASAPPNSARRTGRSAARCTASARTAKSSAPISKTASAGWRACPTAQRHAAADRQPVRGDPRTARVAASASRCWAARRPSRSNWRASTWPPARATCWRARSPSCPTAGYLSVPESISYPTAGGRTAHAFYYPPRNAESSRAAAASRR